MASKTEHIKETVYGGLGSGYISVDHEVSYERVPNNDPYGRNTYLVHHNGKVIGKVESAKRQSHRKSGRIITHTTEYKAWGFSTAVKEQIWHGCQGTNLAPLNPRRNSETCHCSSTSESHPGRNHRCGGLT